MNNHEMKRLFESAPTGSTIELTYHDGLVQSYVVVSQAKGSANYAGITIPGGVTIFSDAVEAPSVASAKVLPPPKRVPNVRGTVIRITKWSNTKEDWTAMLEKVSGRGDLYHVSVDTQALYTPEALQKKFESGSMDFEVLYIPGNKL